MSCQAACCHIFVPRARPGTTDFASIDYHLYFLFGPSQDTACLIRFYICLYRPIWAYMVAQVLSQFGPPFGPPFGQTGWWILGGPNLEPTNPIRPRRTNMAQHAWCSKGPPQKAPGAPAGPGGPVNVGPKVSRRIQVRPKPLSRSGAEPCPARRRAA